ncbi:NAD-dependent epimerase/dehydratase family protein [Actinomadura sp. NPDC048032]|uniref:NAD-dependent epimerase/dehydratase family protein n=1 Tax=Actinomadura sp. NPDC048032 TaxID=3155747 RepID=UPI0033F9E808
MTLSEGAAGEALVLGATGFIGRWLVAELLERGRPVVAAVRGGGARGGELRGWLREHGVVGPGGGVGGGAAGGAPAPPPAAMRLLAARHTVSLVGLIGPGDGGGLVPPAGVRLLRAPDAAGFAERWNESRWWAQ